MSFAEFLQACTRGEQAKIESQLDSGYLPDINACDEDGNTPLCLACLSGHYEIVKLLLERFHDIDVNKENIEGITPLIAACIVGDPRIANLLINHPNIEVNKKTHKGNTPIHEACFNGYIGIIDALLNCQKEIEINEIDVSGMTPLALICAEEGINRIEVLKRLLRYRHIDIEKPDAAGRTPLEMACSFSLEILKHLLAMPTEKIKQSIKAVIAEQQNLTPQVRMYLLANILKSGVLRTLPLQEFSVELIHANTSSYLTQAWIHDLHDHFGLTFLNQLHIHINELYEIEQELFQEQNAAELFATVVFLSDGYLQFPTLPDPKIHPAFSS